MCVIGCWADLQSEAHIDHAQRYLGISVQEVSGDS